MNQEGRKANKGSIHEWVPVTGNWELGSVFSRTFHNVELVSGLSLWGGGIKKFSFVKRNS